MRMLTARERWLVRVTALFIAIAGALQLVVLPALNSRQNSFAQLGKFDRVQAVLDILPAPSVATGAADAPPLRQRVTDSARRAGLDIRRLDPQGASALSVSLDDVAFTALIGWLDHLTDQAMVRVLSAEIGRRPTPGVVSARLLLEAR